MDRQELVTRPVAFFAGLLRQAAAPLDARDIKRRVTDGGIDPDLVDAVWRRAQPALRHHINVSFDATRRTYRWTDSAEVRVRAMRERHVRVDAMRALAEVLMEVEELAAAGADPAVTVQRLRAMAAQQALTPIGRAGATMPYDPAWHTAIGAAPAPGTLVLVIRPGYLWQPRAAGGAGEEIVLGKAQVLSTLEG